MSKPFTNLHPLFSDAYHWLCKGRKNHPPDSDIWNFKHTWNRKAEIIMESNRNGDYRFYVQPKITLTCGEMIAIWSSQMTKYVNVDEKVSSETWILIILNPTI